MEGNDFTVRIDSQEVVEDAPKLLTMQQLEEYAAREFLKNGNVPLFSVGLKDDKQPMGLSYDALRKLALSPQSNLESTLEIISIVRQYVNLDDIIGLTYESIENNVNSELRLSYRGDSEKVNNEIKAVLGKFNDMVGIRSIIERVIPTAWRDGSCVFCLRKKQGKGVNNYSVDFYPLGVAKITDYESGGQPYVLIDINELKSRLAKEYPKTRKNRKGLFFNGIEDEIKATYPEEVYRAYMGKERYAKIPIMYSGVVRVNNQNKPYGLSPIFRALWPTLMLEAFGNADKSTANARAKKIIAQYMNKEILGENYNRNSYGEQAYAHQTLVEAWSLPTVLVTAPATVSKIEYVEPKAETTNINLINFYRHKAMSTLGISFLADSNSSSMSVANISLGQLMKTINKIARQLSDVIEKWYKEVLTLEGFDPAMTPKVKVLDAELMDINMRQELADALFTKFGCSYETAYNLVGFDFEHEKIVREAENKAMMEKVFMPRATSYTASAGDNDGGEGRPANKDSDDPDKQIYDKSRNQNT